MSSKLQFFPDDIDRINKKYFSDIRKNNQIVADPSYWYENYSETALNSGFSHIKNYKSDYHDSLKEEKPIILQILSIWDSTSYGYDDLTVCSSTTSGSLILLSYLKSVAGIKNIYFETPCYFASLKQAELLNYKVNKLPTYYKENFNFDFSSLSDERKIVWLTQPRYGLGKNYEIEHLESLLSKCGKNDFIVIDEATEQLLPAHLANYNFQSDPRILKIRTPFKGIGINGPRISTIIHGEKHRHSIQNILEQVQGAMDIFSLNFAIDVFKNHSHYFFMLASSNNQVKSTYKKLLPRAIGTNLQLSSIENGYISSVLLNYGKTKQGYSKKREKLLQYCSKVKIPVILGANLNFAKDERIEPIRLNYFNKSSELILALDHLAKFSLI